jgi:uncharacterized membrane protein
VKKTLFARWRANFFTGFAVVLPGVVSVGALYWLFGTVATFTDTLLFFLPHQLTHADNGNSPQIYWYWSLVALLLAVTLVTVVGLLARNYIGKRMIEWVDEGLLHVPLLNKIYSATKQVNAALTSGNKTAFKTVVLVEFPRAGSYSIGFLTSEQHDEVQRKLKEKAVCVFVPTTPNPTGGFLIIVPEDKIIKLDMSVADGIKYIISLGAIAPEFASGSGRRKN